MLLSHASTRWLLASAAVSSALFSVAHPAFSQSVISAPDDFATRVNVDGNLYTITGGKVSESGDNLFHSLEQLNLGEQETANFLSMPQVQNIFSRIINNEVSNIDGTLQVTGSAANLYLINPAGLLFGPNATLNLPASFAATTAAGLGFDAGWFDLSTAAVDSFSGAPITFGFDGSGVGTITNTGELGVNKGESLSLIANRVVNDGALSAPGGNIIVAAIANENEISISAAGQILSIEVTDAPSSLLDLPELLTGGTSASADSFQQNADGSISLATAVSVPDVSGIAAISGTLTTTSTQGGDIQILGEQVALVDATLDASGTKAGGSVLVGGDYQGTGPLNSQQTFVGANSRIDTSAIASGDAGKAIIWANDFTEFYGDITARGGAASGNGGFVEISGANSLFYEGTVDTSAVNGKYGTLLFDPKNISIIGDGGPADGDDAGNRSDVLGSTPFTNRYRLSQNAAPTDGTFRIYESELEGMSGSTSIVLQATNNISISDLPDNELLFEPGSGSITFTADADNDGTGAFVMNGTTDVIRAAGRDVKIDAFSANIASIDTSSLERAGDITVLSSGGNIQIAGGLSAEAQESAIASGNIRLEVTDQLGSIIANSSGVTLSTAAPSGNGGNINLSTAGGSIRTLEVTTQSGGAGTAGNIKIEVGQNSQGIGQIDTSSGTLTASSVEGSGGDVRLITAEGNIDTADVDTSAENVGNAGNITARIDGGQGAIDTTSGELQATSVNGDGGKITLATNQGNISLGDVSVDTSSADAGKLSATVNQDTGSIDATVGALSATAQSGSGGNIRLTTQRGNISASNISTTTNSRGQTGGNIALSVEGEIGSIDTTAGTLSAGGGGGNSGSITLKTQTGNVSAGDLNASSTASGSGGNIDIAISSGTGSVDLSSATVNTSSASRNAGNVSFTTASGSIQSRGINASSGGGGRGGNITYSTNPNGSIDTTNGSNQTLDASSANGRGGNVKLSSGVTNVTSVNANGSRGGRVEFFSDETNLADGSLVQTNGGRVQFASLKPGQKIRVGGNADSSASTLDITREDLDRISDNVRYVVIGERGNMGAIQVVPETQFPARVIYRQRRSR